MSTIRVTDKRGGVFQVVVSYKYGECDRLPYNALRKVKARIEQVQNGGIDATAEFNVRNAKDANHFVQVLELFGEDGSFVHGSSADPEILNLEEPPEGEEPGIRAATAESASDAAAEPARTEPLPETKNASAKYNAKKKDAKKDTSEEPGDLEVEPENDEVVYEEEEEPADLETEEDVETETKKTS